MKRIGLKISVVFTLVCVYLLTFAMTLQAADDWQYTDIPEYSDETATLLGMTADKDGHIYVVFYETDPTGEHPPYPKAKKFDGETWTDLGSGYMGQIMGGQCIIRYDDATGRLVVGLITMNGLIHTYELIDGEWEELSYIGRLLRIDPQFRYYDFQMMSDGSLVVAYVDLEEQGSVTAKVYKDGEWTYLGEPGFTDYMGSYVSLTVDHNNQYVYAGVGDERSAVEVWRYSNEGGWQVTDSSGIEAIYPYWIKMRMGESDKPILIYMDAEQEWKTVGMIYDNNTWTYMEPHPFSPMMIRSFGVAMDPEGRPLVVYNDYEHDNKASAMRYNGESWENIGRRGFTTEGITSVSVSIDREGVPLMLFPDKNNSGRILAMKYDEAVSEKEDDSIMPEAREDSGELPDDAASGLRCIVVIPVLVVVIVIIFLILLKRRKKDDDEQ